MERNRTEYDVRYFLRYTVVFHAIVGIAICLTKIPPPLTYRDVSRLSEHMFENLRPARIAVHPKRSEALDKVDGQETRPGESSEGISGAESGKAGSHGIGEWLRSRGSGGKGLPSFGAGDFGPSVRDLEAGAKTAIARRVGGGRISFGDRTPKGGTGDGRGIADSTLGELDFPTAFGVGENGNGFSGTGNGGQGTEGRKFPSRLEVFGTCRDKESVDQVVYTRRMILSTVHDVMRLGELIAVISFTIDTRGIVQGCTVTTEPTGFPEFVNALVQEVSKCQFGDADCLVNVRWTIRF